MGAINVLSMKNRKVIFFLVGLVFIIAFFFVSIRTILLYKYLHSSYYKKDVEYITRKAYEYQNWFLEMPSDCESFLDFAGKNIFDQQDLESYNRSKKYNIKLIFCDSVYISIIRSSVSECVNQINYEDVNVFSLLLDKENILVGTIDSLVFDCKNYNMYTVLTKNQKLVNSKFENFDKELKKLSKKLCLSGEFQGNHYLAFKAYYHDKKWQIEVVCDEEQITNRCPMILNEFESYIYTFNPHEIDYMFFTVLLWDENQKN